eukprot:scaffold67_cov338-Prasinococcus_capsulatus_cf.AAC.10
MRRTTTGWAARLERGNRPQRQRRWRRPPRPPGRQDRSRPPAQMHAADDAARRGDGDGVQRRAPCSLPRRFRRALLLACRRRPRPSLRRAWPACAHARTVQSNPINQSSKHRIGPARRSPPPPPGRAVTGARGGRPRPAGVYIRAAAQRARISRVLEEPATRCPRAPGLAREEAGARPVRVPTSRRRSAPRSSGGDRRVRPPLSASAAVLVPAGLDWARPPGGVEATGGRHGACRAGPRVRPRALPAAVPTEPGVHPSVQLCVQRPAAAAGAP